MYYKKAVHYILAILLSVFSIIAIAAAVGYYLIATPAGAKALVDFSLLQSARFASVEIGSTSGSLAQGLVIKDMKIKNWSFWGPSSYIDIQRLDVRFPLNLDWHKIYARFFNARLYLANSEAFVFNGEFNDGNLLGNAYSRTLDVSVLMKPFLPEDVMRMLHGTVSNADFTFQGPINDIGTRGHFYVDRIQYGTTTLKEGGVRFELSFSQGQPRWLMRGPLVVEGGMVNVRRSIVELSQSRAFFRGDVLNPELLIAGTAKADVYTIDLKVTGTMLNPKVSARSVPYLPDDMAIVVLGLGNLAPSNFTSNNTDSGVNKMGLKKKITDELNLGFELEEMPTRFGQQQGGYAKQLQGEFSITDKVSFNVAEKIAPDRIQYNEGLAKPESRSQGESKFYLKYKNTF